MKTCSTCGREFPATTEYFHKFKHGKNGLKSECKECANKRTREYNATHPEEALKARKKAYDKRRDVILEQKKRYYLENREAILQLRAQEYAADPEKKLERNKKYRQENPDKCRAQSEAYRKGHPEQRRAVENIRRARKKDSGGTHTGEDVKAQYERQKGRCFWCKKKLTKYHVDHVVPLSLGGSNGPENIVIACPSCNCSKQAKHPMEWAGMLL